MGDQTELHPQRSVSPLSRTSFGLNRPSLYHHGRVDVYMGSGSHSGTVQDHQPMLERSRGDEKLAPITKDSRYTRVTSLWSRLETDWWIKEISAMLISILSLVCIVLILRIYDGRPLHDWPFSITINSLVSIFSTIMGMTVLVPLEQCMSQAKWHWFQEYHPLADMDMYDRGSRGPWGALRMLWDVRWKCVVCSEPVEPPVLMYVRHVSSLGALITVLALGIDPFAQQVASYQLKKYALSQNSTLPVRFSFANDLSTEFRGAAYAGLFGSGKNTLTPYCPSGNCTWAPYETLAFCSQCVDVTSLIKQTQSNHQVHSCDPDVINSSCFLSLPNGLSLQQSDSVVSNLSGTLPPMVLDKVGYAIVNFSLLDLTSDPWAAECSLHWCINTYTATLNNNNFSERLENSWYNATNALPLANIPSEDDLANAVDEGRDIVELYNTTPSTGGAKSQSNLNLSVDEMEFDSNEIVRKEDFLVTNTPEVLKWLGPLLSGNVTDPSRPSTDVVDLFYNSYGDSRTSPNANDFKPTIPVIRDAFDRLAQSLSTWIRTSQGDSFDLGMGQAVGVTWTSATIIKVQWAWMALPCVLLAGTLFFLCFTIIRTQRQQFGIWKSSSLALLFHGLEEWNSHSIEDSRHVVDMEEKARRTWVQLVDEGKGARLIERSDLPNKDM